MSGNLYQMSIASSLFGKTTKTLFSPRSYSSLAKMQPLKVYTAGTPNGWPVIATLNEIASYNKDLKWEVIPIDIMKNTQKEDWFLKINPNGRIPAITDPNNGDFAVFETSAIMLYLEKKYDPDHILSWPSSNPKADDLRNEVLQWMFFARECRVGVWVCRVGEHGLMVIAAPFTLSVRHHRRRYWSNAGCQCSWHPSYRSYRWPPR